MQLAEPQLRHHKAECGRWVHSLEKLAKESAQEESAVDWGFRKASLVQCGKELDGQGIL